MAVLVADPPAVVTVNFPVVETVAVTGIVNTTDVVVVLLTVATTVPTFTVAPAKLVPVTVTVAVPRFVPD